MCPHDAELSGAKDKPEKETMAVNKDDVWADLRYGLDELERPRRDAHVRLMADADNLDENGRTELYNRLEVSFDYFLVYDRAIARAQARIAHEAIEKGLKAILLDAGWKNTNSHDLRELLEDVQQLNPQTFGEIERCYESTIRHLKFITGIQRNSSIIDYFRENGNRQAFIENRYASIDGGDIIGGMIVLIYMEVMRALLWLLFDWTPADIESRVERAARKAVLTESGRDAEWDADGWLGQGSVKPRLEAIENQADNRVLRAAVRRCAKDSKDHAVRGWAKRIRTNRRMDLLATRRERDRPTQ